MRGKKNIGKDLFPSSLLIICVVVLTRGVPSEPLLVELDHGLGALDVGLPCGDEVRLVRSLPLDEEHELAAAVCRPDDPLRLEAAVKASRPDILTRMKLLTRRFRSFFATDGAGFPFRLLLLQFQFVFKRLDQLWTVEILFWLPRILFGSKTLNKRNIYINKEQLMNAKL